jgi:MFS family permease
MARVLMTMMTTHDDDDGQIGRKKGFVATLLLVILGTLASAVAYPVGPMSIAAVLAVLRFVLGIGIGGEYPLSATITGSPPLLFTPLILC